MLIATNIIENAFGPLITIFEEILVFAHDNLIGGSWGWAIIGLTIAVRLVLFPVFVRQMKSIVSLQRHMPEMKAIQARYKDDRQRQSEEVMKFYKENKINPFASCLPMLLQLPVFVSLFYMLRNDLKKHICGSQLVQHYNHLHHTQFVKVAQLPTKYIEHVSCETVAPHSAGFLFIPDLTSKATGATLIVLLAVYVLTMVGSSLLSSATADRNQRLMAIFLPLVFTFVVIGFPTGLLVYWISTNIWTVGQAVAVRRNMPSLQPAAATGGTSGSVAGAAAKGADSASGILSKIGLGGGGEAAASANGSSADDALTPPPPPRKRKKRRSGRRR